MKPAIPLVFLILATLQAFAVSPEELYKKDYWQIDAPPGEVRWVEIRNISEAPKTGIAHISIISRKNGAELWEVTRIVPHLAITTNALCSSVTKPIKVRGVYPEAFEEGYARWNEAQKQGKAEICSITLDEYLSQKK